MNAFQRHNIAHLSASSINLFAAQPALWVLEKLMKRSGPVGCAAHRGTAAEAGIVAGLLDHDLPLKECQAQGVAVFDKLTAFSGDSRKDKEREAVPGIVAQGIAELRPYGVPLTQVKIEKTLPGVSVPWIGYVDLLYEEHGVLVDIKSQLRLSSEISTSHARQVSLYTYGTNFEARVAYCTPQKTGVYRVENSHECIGALINIAKRLEAFLSVSDDPEKLAAIVTPDVDSFYYSDRTTRAMVKEVFGL
jgi:hypothetical protein